ncbi:MAG: PepSY-associated TM helix domain-containing protein, partial [Longimicrobiales bacterium]
MRTLIFWAHLATALSAAVIVLIMSATGVLLTYQRQVQTWADMRGIDGAPPSARAVPLAPEALLAGVQGMRDGTPGAIRWRNDPAAPVELVYGPAGSLFVNAYSGAVLGDGSARTRAFFRAVTDWHRWLAMNGAGRSRGRAITGAANLAFLFIVLSGFYLWWPQNLTARGLRNVLLFRRGLSGKARDFNWHNVIGVWSLVPLTIVIISAVVISYGWASDILYRIAGDDGPSASAAPAVAAQLPPGASATRSASAEATSETALLVERARALMPDWRIITMQLPPRDRAIVFSLDRGDGGQPQKRVQVTLAAATGAVLKWEPFSSG